VKVSFTVTNTGNLAGAEIAELYVGQQNPPLARPIKELKGFQKVFLQPGESQKVTLELDQRSVAYFNTAIQKWMGCRDNVLVGASSQDIRLCRRRLHLGNSILLRREQPIPTINP
jgi:beta-glucosidase